ncbi:Epoxide hydrolase A [Pseudocercospora fuligena]|uniref:Epoxide hydrolase A n=1 Tax=Pseudocercospora fuligena TaxID=685502 RepID=A0A8H6VK29_9PEZI|nr:Epoxide hydrolase A [Pseudocercospora fuligena]
MAQTKDLEPLTLPAGVSEDYVDCTASCGLNWHVLKAGEPGKPLVLFCHGYPELAYSWRRILPEVAKVGYYAVAMDQRGYGRTTGWEDKPYDQVDLTQYVFTNLVRDLVCLVYKLGYTEAAAIIGHDFGAVSSAMAALMRPDVFKATIQMSHPHHPPPAPQLGDQPRKQPLDIQAELAKLNPPRKHYKWYNSSPGAAEDWNNPPQGLEKYLRGYFHLKSADWDKNDPHPLKEWSAKEIEVMPEYYVMAKDDTFPQSIEKNMKGEDYRKTESWLPPEDLAVYVKEWSRVGFQGALNWYRAQTASTTQSKRDMLLYAGRRIEVPCAFISGKQDWGNYQQPGAFEAYEDPKAVKPGCFRGATLIEHAGHWVQQEQSEKVTMCVLGFLKSL